MLIYHENRRFIATKEGSHQLEKEQTALHYRQLIQGHTEIIAPKDHMGPNPITPFPHKKGSNIQLYNQ